MKKSILLFIAMTLSACGTAYGPLNRSIATDINGAATGNDIRLSFGKQTYISGKNLGIAKTLKSHRYNTKDGDKNAQVNAACRKSFTDAVAAIKQQARELGGNAVVNIYSYWRDNVLWSGSEYYCQGGKVKGTVGLHGTIVKE